ncbi:MAG: hypothetical protein IJJ33_19205 [Victivallales bacterium]|nr:hypothetical protein [Victivallales bacterium]
MPSDSLHYPPSSSEEYLPICREFYDFTAAMARRYRADHLEKTFSEILRRHTLLSWWLRDAACELSEFPSVVEEFLSACDMNFDAAVTRFRPILSEFASRNFAGAYAWNPLFAQGRSVRWQEPHPELPPSWCIIHLWNGVRPRSFLNDAHGFAVQLVELLEAAAKAYPQYDTLYTFSWLLSEPRFLCFFPEEWLRNLGSPHSGIHANLGFLGQFIAADGRLNRRTAQFYLDTGRLLFQPRSSHCSFKAMREHLQTHFLS